MIFLIFASFLSKASKTEGSAILKKIIDYSNNSSSSIERNSTVNELGGGVQSYVDDFEYERIKRKEGGSLDTVDFKENDHDEKNNKNSTTSIINIWFNQIKQYFTSQKTSINNNNNSYSYMTTTTAITSNTSIKSKIESILGPNILLLLRIVLLLVILILLVIVLRKYITKNYEKNNMSLLLKLNNNNNNQRKKNQIYNKEMKGVSESVNETKNDVELKQLVEPETQDFKIHIINN